jgi:hypothetical protein
VTGVPQRLIVGPIINLNNNAGIKIAVEIGRVGGLASFANIPVRSVE